MTHNCILSTIVHALHLDFAVEFLSDAGGSVSYANSAGYASAEDIHRVLCVVLQSRFAAVLQTAEWATCSKRIPFPSATTSTRRIGKQWRTRRRGGELQAMRTEQVDCLWIAYLRPVSRQRSVLALVWRPVADRSTTNHPQHFLSWPGLGNDPPAEGVNGIDHLVAMVLAELSEPLT